MLTDKAQQGADFVGVKVNKVTRTANERRWKKNIQINKPHYIKGNPPLVGLATYLIGAGPSLDKNVDELKKISKRGVIVCVDANFEYLINKGITPEYCVSIDASNKIYKMVKKVMNKTKDTMLVCTTSANPKVVSKWQGPVYFFSTPHPRLQSKADEYFALSRYVVAKKEIKPGEELMFNKNYKVVFAGAFANLPCGGNVTTSAHMFCITCLKASMVVFVGCDFSWEMASHFYSGRRHIANINKRTLDSPSFDCIDSNGKKVYTNLSLHGYKRWHENVILQNPTRHINATEGGILGIDEKGKKEPFVFFSKLRNVIKDYTPKEKDGHDREKKHKNSRKT